MTSSSSSSSSPLVVQVAARLIAERRFDAAVGHLEALVEDMPAYAAAQVLMARALELGGQTEAARRAWHRASSLVPNSPLVQRERRRLLEHVSPDQETPDEEVTDEDVPAPESAPTHERDAEVEVLPPTTEQPEPPSSTTTDGADDTAAEGWSMIDETDTPRETTSASVVSPVSPAAPPVSSSIEAFEGEDIEDVEAGDVDVAEAVGGAPRSSSSTAAGDETRREEPEDPGRGAEARPPGVADELDRLIQQLEGAPRIRPDPSYKGPEVSFSGSEDAKEMVSETLAKIYAAQKQYAEAAVVYDKLAAQRPEQAREMRRLAEEMRGKAAG